ncbi:hypothetical protein ANSO36C_16940 [Nostoc cf. commune SO-36]|uniref:Uncharacterized protein n=1 Tax=Nostoc cf. commune SO-36 TaxID=449208 RepID=A0ABN6Q3C6_NOSCO|nr:hypothetical protein ANSO36C_16940 [Nostoc cf. commune SO-36]
MRLQFCAKVSQVFFAKVQAYKRLASANTSENSQLDISENECRDVAVLRLYKDSG